MTALSIVRDAMEAVSNPQTAIEVVSVALDAAEEKNAPVQGELEFPETQEGGNEVVGEGKAEAGDGLDGVKVESVGDDSVRFVFRFKYSPDKYDSTVDDGSSNGDAGVDEVEVQEELTKTAEDAAIASTPTNAVENASLKCKATFEECKAKNPYACKYHGQKLMEADLYALLSAKGAKTAKVELKQVTKGAYEAAITCIDTPSEKAAAKAAITSFLKKKGINKESVIDFGYDKTEKNHSALFDVDDLDKGAKTENDMHVNHEEPVKEEPKQKPEDKNEEVSAEKEEEGLNEEVKAETVEEPEQTGGDAVKSGDVDETKEEVKEKVEEKQEVTGEPPELTDEQILSALKKAFPSQTIGFSEKEQSFKKWKEAITKGTYSFGENSTKEPEPLNEANLAMLEKLIDNLPADDPVAKVAAATLAKLNAATGEEESAKTEGGKNHLGGKSIKPFNFAQWEKEQKKKKAKMAKKESEPQAAETKSLEVSTEGGTSGTETDGSAKYADLTGAFSAALNDAQSAGVDKDTAVVDAIDGVNSDLAAVDASDEMIEDCKSALEAVEKDEKMLPSAKDVKKTVMRLALESAKGERGKSMESLEKSVKELTDKVNAAKANKIISKAKDAVKAVEEEVKGTFPYLDGLIKTSAISEAYNATEDFKNECANYGIDADQLSGTDNLGIKATNFKTAAIAYSTALNEFAKAAGSGDADAKKVEEHAQKVAEAGKKMLSSYKLLELAKEKASQSLQAKVKENQYAEAAKAAKTQASTPSASATPTDKKAAIKAKIAAMSPKEKAAKAIEIVKKKLAADPGNEDLQKQLQKFEALAAKLG